MSVVSQKQRQMLRRVSETRSIFEVTGGSPRAVGELGQLRKLGLVDMHMNTVTLTDAGRRAIGEKSEASETANLSDAQIAFMYAEGMSIRDIAGAYGMGKGTVENALKRTGTPRRTKQEAQLTPSALVKTGRTDPKTESKIVELYLSGQSAADVAAALGINPSTVWKVLARHDVGGHPQKRTPADVERKVIDAYQAGTPPMEIGRAFGMTATTVRNILIRNDVARRPVRLFQENPTDGMDCVILRQIQKQEHEGGGWANMKRVPGGSEFVWRMVDEGLLEEDGGFVRLTEAGKRTLAQENPTSSPLICMGREVAFVINGKEIEAPKRAGMLYDASGTHWPSCSLLVTSFENGKTEVDDGADYFGREAIVYEGHVELPAKSLDGWRKVGEVSEIFYDRAGTKHPGPFKHTFHKPRGLWKLIFVFKKAAKEPVILYRRGQSFRVELPKGCIVDDRGIVLP